MRSKSWIHSFWSTVFPSKMNFVAFGSITRWFSPPFRVSSHFHPLSSFCLFVRLPRHERVNCSLEKSPDLALRRRDAFFRSFPQFLSAFFFSSILYLMFLSLFPIFPFVAFSLVLASTLSSYFFFTIRPY